MTDIDVNNPIQLENVADVPKSLKNWFIIHFIIDYLIAIPLFLVPEYLLGMLGWKNIDPLSARVVSAALFAIGGISFLSRSAQVDTYKSLVLMKIVWSITAELGMLISILLNPENYSIFAWMFFGVFVVFTFIWIYWWIILKKSTVKFPIL